MKPRRFFWWDDAVAYAHWMSAGTGRRHTVRRTWHPLTPWAVTEVGE